MKKCEIIKVPICKKEVSFKDVSDEDIVNDFMNDYYSPVIWENDYEHINDLEYFFEDYADLTEEDKERILTKIHIAARKKDEEYKEEEKKLLKNRSCILAFLDRCVEDTRENYDYFKDKPIVGIYLEAEEILNLILKNGNKVLKVVKNES